MATIKLDHVELLVGASNFQIYKCGVSQVLQGEGYWGHVEGDVNVFSPFPASPEPPPPTAASTEAELLAFRTWWINNSRARTIIERRISPVVLSLLPQGISVTARNVWSTLHRLYNRTDVMAQFTLRSHLSSLVLADEYDLDRFIGEFQLGRRRFAEMGVAYSELEMVHQILSGLPSSPTWTSFKQLMTQVVQDHLDHQANALIPPPPDALLNRVISRLDMECQRIQSQHVSLRSSPAKSAPHTVSHSAPPENALGATSFVLIDEYEGDLSC